MLCFVFLVSYFLLPIIGIAESNPKCDLTVIVNWSHHRDVDFGQIVPEGEALTPDDINQPRALTVDSKGNIYFGDSVKYRVLKFQNDGKLINKIRLQKATKTKQPRYGHIIKDLAVDKYDNLYVLNLYEYRVEVYSPNGDFLRSIYYYKDKLGLIDDERMGVMYEPKYIDVDKEGNVYIYSGLSEKYPSGGVYSSDGHLTKKGVYITREEEALNAFKMKMIGYSGYFLEVEYVAIDKAHPFNVLILRDKDGKKLGKCSHVNVEMPSKQYIDKDGNVFFIEFNTLNICKVKMLN